MSKAWVAIAVVMTTCVAGVNTARGRASASTTIVVTTTADDLTTNGDCTLREAILAADTDAAVDACAAGNGSDTVIAPAGTYTLALGELAVSSNVSLVGVGGATVIDGGGVALNARAFHVLSRGTLSVSKLTVQHAASAFRNDGTLSLTKVNVAQVGTDGNNVDPTVIGASGIDNHGTATVTNGYFTASGDLVDDNQPQALFLNPAGASLTLTSSTVRDLTQGVHAIDVVSNSGNLKISKTIFDGTLSTGKTSGGGFAAGPGAVEVEISRAGLNVKSLASAATGLI